MDITDTLAPKSDQLDAVDLLGGPMTFTVERVSRGSAEQPVQVHLAEFPRVWRPSKGMRRVLAACWGPKSDQWTGRRVRLFCDPDVRFGKDRVGGTRISHLSHIEGTQRVPMIVSAGRSAIYTVEPLTDTPAPTGPTPDEIARMTDLDELKALWKAHPDLRGSIESRVAEIKAQAQEPDDWGQATPDQEPGGSDAR